jgi:replication-associated recombination protein RarA
MSAPWTETYRPLRFADIKGHRRIRYLFEQAARHQCQRLPPLILYGPPGTGKTSLAMALASETYPTIPSQLSSLYLNASDERSIEVIRERILQFTRTTWPGVTRKFVIFDEVETMTEPAQISLRALLDEVDAEGHRTSPLYMFLCNSLYRIHSSIRSRCVSLFCGHIPIAAVREAVITIQEKEGVPVRTPSDVTFRLQRGDLRSFVSAIQCGGDLNAWDSWLDRLLDAGRERCSVGVWDDGLRRAPFSLLLRHVFLFLEMKGLLTSKLAAFVALCVEVQDASIESILTEVPPVWEECF